MVWGAFAVILGMLAILYFLAVFFFLPALIERRLENRQNEYAKRQLEEIRSTYKEMRGWRHDFRNHMHVLRIYLENGEVEKCQAYLLQLEKDLEEVDLKVKSGNAMADAILNSKMSLAGTKDIRLDVTARIPEKLPISDTEFSVVFGNLMDNAMEACEKIARQEERFIRVYIGIYKKQFYISVTNATNQTKRVERYITEKGAGHGFGLYRIDKIVKKYQGYLKRKNEPGVFVTEIMLPYIKGEHKKVN
ncbi:ATP-binding protein [bacterium D16-51]|nr:ATP-binding protein [bacterium D16-59]RKI57979.1 ATP-binding protein [bacterium D16-51]